MLSFAMFFLLLIYERQLRRRGATYNLCKHLLHREHHICFLKGNILASFKVSSIQLHDLVMPSPFLEMPCKDPCKEQMINELGILSNQCRSLFVEINEKLNKVKSDNNGQTLLSSNAALYLGEAEKDFENLKKFSDDIDSNICEGTQLQEMRISILMLKVSLLKHTTTWKSKLALLGELKKKEDKTTNAVVVVVPLGGASSRHPSESSKLSSTTSLEKTPMSTPRSSKRADSVIEPSVITKECDSELTKNCPGNNSTTKSSQIISDDGICGGGNALTTTKLEEKLTSTSTTTSGSSSQLGAKSKWHSHSSNNSNVDFQLSSPFPTTLHPDLYLKPGVLVDENQPSSIIAYTLASSKYEVSMIKMRVYS